MAAPTETTDATPDVPELDIGALATPPKDGKGDAADTKNALDGHHEVPPLMRGNPAVLNAFADPAVSGEKKVLNTAAKKPKSLQEPADDDPLSSLESGGVLESDLCISETSTDGETSTDSDLETRSSDSTDGTETEDSDMEDP